ncbi:hypothetical protein OIU34_25030 [Pararhizobium sp. BT-229]|nr:hypothetical protein [Pararhizobium sp. BT-229]MCV9965145.1 hypothetical protein [Pararhizobium sp. BT-229]
MYALIDSSNRMLEHSAFDMEGEIRDEATEQFAVKKGRSLGRSRTSRAAIVPCPLSATDRGVERRTVA